MSIQFRIDTSGSVIVRPDSATTSSKHVTLFLVAITRLAGYEVTYDNDSPITNVSYDTQTNTLSWNEQGQYGLQTVTITNPSLISLMARIMNDHQTAGDISTALAEILSAIPTSEDIQTIVHTEVGSIAIEPTDLTPIANGLNGLMDRCDTITAMLDSSSRKGSNPPYLEGR